MIALNLSGNNLTGAIPQKIGQLKQLQSLDLSGNQLSGVISMKMADLYFLNFLNLSNNHLYFNENDFIPSPLSNLISNYFNFNQIELKIFYSFLMALSKKLPID